MRQRQWPPAPSFGATTESPLAADSPHAESAAAVSTPRAVAHLSGKQQNRIRNANRNARKRRAVVLDRLDKLMSHFWTPDDCIKTVHACGRIGEGRISWLEFHLTWTQGVWRADEAADTFTATWNRCEIVVGFEEETPKLVTAKYVAAHKAA